MKYRIFNNPKISARPKEPSQERYLQQLLRELLTLRKDINELNEKIQEKLKQKSKIITPEEEKTLQGEDKRRLEIINHIIANADNFFIPPSIDPNIQSGDTLKELKTNNHTIVAKIAKLEREKSLLNILYSAKNNFWQFLCDEQSPYTQSIDALRAKFIEEENTNTHNELTEERKPIEQQLKTLKPQQDGSKGTSESKIELHSVSLVKLKTRFNVYLRELEKEISGREKQYNGCVRFPKTKEKLDQINEIKATILTLKKKIRAENWDVSNDLTTLLNELGSFKTLAESNRSAWGSGFWESQCGATTKEKIFSQLAESWIKTMKNLAGEIQNKQGIPTNSTTTTLTTSSTPKSNSQPSLSFQL